MSKAYLPPFSASLAGTSLVSGLATDAADFLGVFDGAGLVRRVFAGRSLLGPHLYVVGGRG